MEKQFALALQIACLILRQLLKRDIRVSSPATTMAWGIADSLYPRTVLREWIISSKREQTIFL
jgi:hypothetical protein